MTSVGLSFLILFVLIALFPAGLVASVVYMSRRAGTKRAGLILAAVIYSLAAYSTLAGVVILPSDSMIQNVLFMAAITCIVPAGIVVLLVALYLSR